MIEEIRLNELHGYIIKEDGEELVNIKDSPHYQYLKGNKKPYEDYIKLVKNKRGQKKSVEPFQELIKNFDHKKALCYGISHGWHRIECRRINGKLVLIDGLHRSCILLHKGCKTIKVEVK